MRTSNLIVQLKLVTITEKDRENRLKFVTGFIFTLYDKMRDSFPFADSPHYHMCEKALVDAHDFRSREQTSIRRIFQGNLTENNGQKKGAVKNPREANFFGFPKIDTDNGLPAALNGCCCCYCFFLR